MTIPIRVIGITIIVVMLLIILCVPIRAGVVEELLPEVAHARHVLASVDVNSNNTKHPNDTSNTSNTSNSMTYYQ